MNPALSFPRSVLICDPAQFLDDLLASIPVWTAVIFLHMWAISSAAVIVDLLPRAHLGSLGCFSEMPPILPSQALCPSASFLLTQGLAWRCPDPAAESSCEKHSQVSQLEQGWEQPSGSGPQGTAGSALPSWPRDNLCYFPPSSTCWWYRQGKAHSQIMHYVADVTESNFIGEGSWKRPPEKSSSPLSKNKISNACVTLTDAHPTCLQSLPIPKAP